MKIKRIESLKVNSFDFKVVWDAKNSYAGFCWSDHEITIGTENNTTNEIFGLICHELMEICAVEMNVRLQRPDCRSDYIFVYDHRQHDTMSNMFAGLLTQFIK